MKEIDKYLEAKQNLIDVSPSGKDYAACSFMDISVRSDRLDAAKHKLITALGKQAFSELALKGKL